MSNQPWVMYPLGDAAVLIEFGDRIGLDVLASVQDAMASLEREPICGVVECVPSYTTLTVYYDITQIAHSHHNSSSPYEALCLLLEARLAHVQQQSLADSAEQSPVIRIPVCYGDEFGPDLNEVAAYHSMSSEEVVRIHTGADYTIYAIGFAPGFPYLGGMSESIAVPRKGTPRLRIPEGSVGIAGTQTGIYPLETPGGWQIIGRTPLRLFQPEQDPPVLLTAGRTVQFYPITAAQYEAWHHLDDEVSIEEQQSIDPDSIHRQYSSKTTTETGARKERGEA